MKPSVPKPHSESFLQLPTHCILARSEIRERRDLLKLLKTGLPKPALLSVSMMYGTAYSHPHGVLIQDPSHHC